MAPTDQIKNSAYAPNFQKMSPGDPTVFFGRPMTAETLSGWLRHVEMGEEDLTIVTIPGAGHFVQQDASDLVTSTMHSWLSARLALNENGCNCPTVTAVRVEREELSFNLSS